MKTTRSTAQLNIFNWSQFQQFLNSNQTVGSAMHVLLLSLTGTGLTLLGGCGSPNISSQEVTATASKYGFSTGG
jgi:hypothetical protein